MIELRGLYAGYDGAEILHGIDARFPKGQVSVLCGPNGCGKSTTVKALLRLVPETRGAISIDGEPLERFSQKELAQRVAYVPQSRNVPDITVYRLVMHGRFPYLSYPAATARRTTPASTKRSTGWSSCPLPSASWKASPAASGRRPIWRWRSRRTRT